MGFTYDETASERSETESATVALGCFWGPDARFGAMESVVRTRVGYAGGTKAAPTYERLGDHTEAVQIDYHPEDCSYRDIVDSVMAAHDPHQQPSKTQYQNIIFYVSDDEQAAIESVLTDHGVTPENIATRIEPLGTFHPAEAYHQKYRLRNHQLADQFADYSDGAFRESPAAATLNGYIAGHIGRDELNEELRTLVTSVEPA